MVKNKMIITITITILVVLLLVVSNVFAKANGSSEDISDYTNFNGLLTLLKEEGKDYTLVDVRTIEEYSAGHIPTAINIPYDFISSNLPGEDKGELIVVYCRSGRRSGIAKQTLIDLGFTNIYDFGAYSKWEENFIKGQNPGEI